MAGIGWDATGALTPLYEQFGGRDAVAKIVQISGTELSSINSGEKRLGLIRAQRIADALGISLVDLGAPEAAAVHDPRSQPVLGRLAELEALVTELSREVRALAEAVAESRRVQPRRRREETGP